MIGLFKESDWIAILIYVYIYIFDCGDVVSDDKIFVRFFFFVVVSLVLRALDVRLILGIVTLVSFR